jgi:hypothetical protein
LGALDYLLQVTVLRARGMIILVLFSFPTSQQNEQIVKGDGVIVIGCGRDFLIRFFRVVILFSNLRRCRGKAIRMQQL